TTAEAEKFNSETPDAEGVYYQSFGFCMKNWYSDLLMSVPYLAVKLFEGESDGLLAPRAVKWTNFRGVYRGDGRQGISHCHQVDLLGRKIKVTDGNESKDITEFYADIVRELKEMGY
ncbi:MAG: triacylglycerol lipase, partial [Clostridia bacterium]